ncbi:putative NF-X1 finger and helicase domain protein [Aspergillus mulundensis]|uniref:Uncharacterized protein n=1 Tax=Aspergillus mulundensis TaxID=1810919 RepID=A0A3D8RWZ4_9EURO|nr:hypothetical protein DSM5745_05415 [Aspergillus mulundensis]RDW78563.1 hypothetical protein DSM5745_05415 [Aspergillus mulundensis]
MSFSRACREFKKTGSCSHKACRKSHPKPLHAPLYPQASEKDNGVQSWKRTAHARCTVYIAPEFLEAFFVGARSLVERDSESMQEVICYMSEEDGLRYIQQLVEREFAALPPAIRIEMFRSQVVPFLETISHPRVLSSLFVEHALGGIYNFIYGVGGTRAAHLISSICSVLETLSEDDETRAQWLEGSLVVFHRIMFANSTAFIQTGLEKQALKLEDILTTMDKGDMSGKLHISRRYLNQLLSRTKTGAHMQTQNTEESNHAQIIKFVPRQELPGGRHGNDHKDFSLVQIMPTIEEILSPRQEYLPERDPSSWHVSGLEGLLDRNFRLLREDNVGIIRDAIHHVIKASPGKSPRANVYKGARIVKSKFHWNSGFVFQVSFPQPTRLRRMAAPQREAWWSDSRCLQPGTLVCLTIDGDHAAFCTVTHGPDEQSHIKDKSGRKSEKATRFGTSLKGADEVFVLLTTLGPDERTVRSILDIYDDREQLFLMTEFPGVLLPSFEPTLRALQRIKRTNQIPFENFLVPSQSDNLAMIPPPLYSLRNGFQFNLRCLMTDDADFFVHPDMRVNPEKLYSSSILDQAQVKALVNSLQHCIGLIQGPPGTGKSYTGIALIQVLLANKYANGGNIGPILCVSYTNHALDQLLESLLDRKITEKIVRIGSQSRSERLIGCNLRDISKLAAKTREEKSMQKSLRHELQTCEDKFNRLSFQHIPASKVPPYLYEYYPDHFEQLFYSDEYDLKPSQVKNPGAIIKAWLTSGMGAENEPGRSFKDLLHVNIYSMNRAERTTVYHQWLGDIAEETVCEAIELVSAHAGVKHNWDRIRSEVDLRCLADADVIGVTTTGLANNLEMLQKLQVRVVICEEAAEVLEAHLLTALLPSVEHAIFIGDHLQLRPVVQNYDLSRENPNGGDRYSLDVSLFERLVDPRTAFGAGLPYSTLETQRRMHPSIASLIRDTLYPDLKDAACVSDYPRVSGMKQRLFWLDHRFYEGNTADDAVATSHWNEHEVEMTIALVNHLVSQGDRKSGEIAVLTPYLGQLHRLRQRLSKLFAICIGERDQEDLEKAGLKLDKGVSPAVKSNLLEALRVSTVDNFQGEEAKIVVISLVRSNPQNRCGFLSTPNRINVLLSRAQHGLYILGNSETSMHIPMWAQSVPDTQMPSWWYLSPATSYVFLRKAAAICDAQSALIVVMLASSDATPTCCIMQCFAASLALGHEWAAHIPAPSYVETLARLTVKHLLLEKEGSCHVDIRGKHCHVFRTRTRQSLTVKNQSEKLSLAADMMFLSLAILMCPPPATNARTHAVHNYHAVMLAAANATSATGLMVFAMANADSCVVETTPPAGIPVKQPAMELSLVHPVRQHAKSAASTRNAQGNATSHVRHAPKRPVFPPVHTVPVHCHVQHHVITFPAHSGARSSSNVVTNARLSAVSNVRRQGSVSMDAQMNIAKYYMLDIEGKPVSVKEALPELFRMADIKNCALCRGHLRDIARYGRLVRQALLDDSTKKFVLYLNREYLPLAEEMARRIQSLKDLEYNQSQKTRLASVVRINGDRAHQLQIMRGALGYLSTSRWGDILKMHEQIAAYRDKVSPGQQPFIRVLAMVESARRKNNIAIEEFNGANNMLQLKGVLLAATLSLRLHIALLTDFLRMKGRARTRLTLDLSKTREECKSLIESAKDSRLPSLEAEGHLFLAQLHALERCHCIDSTASKTHLDTGLASLERARGIITTFPMQTKGLESEIDAAETMFLSTFYSIVTNAERLAVVQAMASEFVGTGHWYYCGNGHPFTIGECGGAIQESLCPECGAPVGGRQHRVVEGVTRADDLEESGSAAYW